MSILLLLLAGIAGAAAAPAAQKVTLLLDWYPEAENGGYFYASFLRDPNYIQQCFVTSEPPIMAHSGVKVRTLWVKDTGCDAYMALESSDRFVAANPEVVRAIVAATIAGWRGYLADPAAADAEILRRNPAMTAVQLNLSRKALLDYHLADGTGAVGQIDPDRMKNQYTILRDLNIIAADYDYTKSFTTVFLPRP